jgi:YD repeat-containing protein
VQVTHDSTGLLRELRDPRDRVYRFGYDVAGRLLADTAPDGGLKTLEREVGEASLFSGGGLFDVTNSVTSLIREYHRARYLVAGGNFGLDRLRDLRTRTGFPRLPPEKQGRLLGRLANLQRLQGAVRLAGRALAVSNALNAVSGALKCRCR